MPARPVKVHHLALLTRNQDANELRLELTVSKGYYVRSLARDLGQQLGLPAYLTALCRTASGQFKLAEAGQLDQALLRERLIPLPRAAALALPSATLTDQGVSRARCGQALDPDDFLAAPPPSRPSAWFDGSGTLVAIGSYDAGHFRVRRGFSYQPE